MKKENLCIYDYYSATKKEENIAICDNMDGPWRYYAKWKKPDRERQISHNVTHIWNLRKNTHTNKNPKLINPERRLVVARGTGWGMGKMDEAHQRHKLQAVKWMSWVAIDSMVTTANNVVLYISKLLREPS